LPRTANAGQPVAFSWSGRRLGRGHRLVIQKPEGTAHTWRTIIRLPSNRGSAQLSGLALGKYRFRIADLAGRRVLAQQVDGVAVFGEVPFTTLLREHDEHIVATPSTSFPYIERYWGTPQPAFSVGHTNCLSVHIAFVGQIAPGHHPEPGTATVTVIQETRDPVSASFPYEVIGGLDAELVLGQSWAVNIDAGPGYIYVNGYAVCDNAEPFSH
jgi:hypothetical protein